MDISTISAFGHQLNEQVKERLHFYEEGVAPTEKSAATEVSHLIMTAIPCRRDCLIRFSKSPIKYATIPGRGGGKEGGLDP